MLKTFFKNNFDDWKTYNGDLHSICSIGWKFLIDVLYRCEDESEISLSFIYQKNMFSHVFKVSGPAHSLISDFRIWSILGIDLCSSNTAKLRLAASTYSLWKNVKKYIYFIWILILKIRLSSAYFPYIASSL